MTRYYLNYETNQTPYIRYGTADLHRADLQSKLADHVPQNLYTQERLNIPASELKNYTQFRNNVVIKTPAWNTGYQILQSTGRPNGLKVPTDLDPSGAKYVPISGLRSDTGLWRNRNNYGN